MKEFDKKSSPSREGFSKFLPASMSDSSTRRRLTEYEIQVQDLQAYIRSLEAETVHLRKKLEDTPKDFMVLENKLREANRQLVQAFNQNEKLVNALYEAREQITALKEEVDKLCAPPSTYGVYLAANEDNTVTILSQGRKVKVNLHPALKPVDALKPGQELILNEGLNVIEAAGYEIQGEVVILKEQLDAERALVTLRADEEKVGIIAEPLRTLRLKTGDHLLLDAKSGYLLEKLPKSEVEDLTLEEVPDVGYDDIGGLGDQIEAIKDAVELPYLYADYYKEHKLTPPKGVLLYGPPGCGKTMIAKAVANNLAEKISEKRGEKIKGFFLNIKGPELPQQVRRRDRAEDPRDLHQGQGKGRRGRPRHRLLRRDGRPLPDARHRHLLRRRDHDRAPAPGRDRRRRGSQERHRHRRLQPPGPHRSGHPASRPARREDQDRAARPRLRRRHLRQVPHGRHPLRGIRDAGHRRAQRHHLHDRATVEAMYALSEENRFLEVTYANGDKEVLYFKDFSSGAMIESVVRRAKKLALKRYIGRGEKGIMADDLLTAVREEFKENEDLPNTTNPDDWAKIAGKKGERIVYVKPLMGETKEKLRSVERVVNTGQYL